MAFLRSRLALLALAIGILIVLGLPAASLYYEYSAGESCARCHEIRSEHSSWQTSTHRAVACGACHGEILTFDPGFHLGNARRLVQHIRGAYRDPIRLRTLDVNAMVGPLSEMPSTGSGAMAERPARHHLRERFPRSKAQPQPPF